MIKKILDKFLLLLVFIFYLLLFLKIFKKFYLIYFQKMPKLQIQSELNKEELIYGLVSGLIIHKNMAWV